MAAAAARTHRRRVWAFFVILVVVTVGLFWLRFSIQDDGPREGETTRLGVDAPEVEVEVQGQIVIPDTAE